MAEPYFNTNSLLEPDESEQPRWRTGKGAQGLGPQNSQGVTTKTTCRLIWGQLYLGATTQRTQPHNMLIELLRQPRKPHIVPQLRTQDDGSLFAVNTGDAA